MSTRPSAYREAIEDRLTTHAQGAALDELAGFFRLERPPGYRIDDWRQGVYSVAYGPRGNPGGVHAFLEAVMREWMEEVEIEIRPTSPTRIYSADHSFVQLDVGRLVRIPGHGLFASVCPVTVDGGSADANAGAWLDLCPMGMSRWDPARFAVTRITRATAQLLPFLVCEVGPASDNDGRPHGGVPCQVHLWVYSASLAQTPPHYLQPSAQPRADLTGSPEGGEILSGVLRSGHPVRGPWPFYISGDGLRSLRATLDTLHAPGITTRVYRARMDPAWLPDQFNRRSG